MLLAVHRSFCVAPFAFEVCHNINARVGSFWNRDLTAIFPTVPVWGFAAIMCFKKRHDLSTLSIDTGWAVRVAVGRRSWLCTRYER